MVRLDLLKQEALVGGAWVGGDSWIEVDDPATGAIVGRVPRLGAAAARQAIEASHAAMRPWRALAARERANILRRYFNLMVEHRDALAELLTREQGKPLAEARGEIEYAATFLEFYAEEAVRIYGDVIPGHARDKRIIVLREPIGVVAAITPWNFPAAMVTRKIAPALAAGCGLVLKPASQTPFTALAIAALGIEAGLPPALLSIVTGSSTEIGAELTANPLVRKLTFTGSTAVGAKLFAQSAPTIKKLSLELGGNAPFIVFDDADVDKAVQGAIQSKFRNAGQTCVCANRFYVQAGVYNRFVDAFAMAIARLKVGDGRSEDVAIGPLIDLPALAKVEEHIADAVQKGGFIVCGGKRHALGGRFFEPTLIRDGMPSMLVNADETFGPLAVVMPFKNESEVIALANASEFGLASYLYANDLSRVWRVAEQLEAGIVGVNTGLISTASAPFGGVKASGLGREGSRYGLEDYLETKYICLNVDDAASVDQDIAA